MYPTGRGHLHRSPQGVRVCADEYGRVESDAQKAGAKAREKAAIRFEAEALKCLRQSA